MKPSNAPFKYVQAVQFGVLSPEFIKEFSVCEVKSCDYTNPECIHPTENSLSDIRMGPVVWGGRTVIRCATDNLDHKDCPGYFGHIKLARPVYHINFVKTIVRILSCVSYRDSSLLIGDISGDLMVLKGENKLRRIVEKSRGITECPKTGFPQPTYRLFISEAEGIRVIMEFRPTNLAESLNETCKTFEKTSSRELSPMEALDILKQISDDDVKMLGFDPLHTRPEWMIITVLPIPPPQVRPEIVYDTMYPTSDDLTIVLADIIRENNRIHKLDATDADHNVINAAVSRLQTRIAGYFDNSLPNLERLKHMGRTIKSISERLKGKHGRIRGNLMGKRVDFSARTVITGDASIALDELGVPNSISRNLTYPEVVYQHNLEWLQRIVELKAFKRIIRDIGTEIRSYFKVMNSFLLEIGDIVERHLVDGDIVLFNRQPSLHKMSMMGHRIRILPYSTFRLNLSVTTPYNADFDGDEMNMHVPQTYETRAEIKGLMMVPLNIVSPQRNKPVIGIVQDTLLGCNLITRRDVFISRQVMMSLCMCLENWDGFVPIPTIIKPKSIWTGKQVLNLLLPRINLWNACEGVINIDDPDFSLNDAYVNISNGDLLSGILCKKTLGQSTGGLVHITWMEYGPETTRVFITNIQLCISQWLLQNGMSIGIGDAVADQFTTEKIKQVILFQKNEVERIIRSYQDRKIEADPGLNLIETFEKAVNQVLNEAREHAGKAAQLSLRDDNNMKRMVVAGSKGNDNNISQVMAFVAQQNVEGRRIDFGFQDRSLPHFVKGDYGPKSKGFVESSYLSGLKPHEFFFHAMGGREGIIDTAVKTADSGYIQRKLVKSLEDLSVRYDETVRNSEEYIIQFLYGEDGLDGSRLEAQKIDHIKMTVDELEETYRYNFNLPYFNYRSWLSKQNFDYLMCDNTQKILEKEFSTILNLLREMREGFVQPEKADDYVVLPVHLKRLILNCQKKFSIQPAKPVPSNLSPISVVENLEKLVNKLNLSANTCLETDAYNTANRMFHNLILSTLASKRVLREYKLSEEAFEWLLQEIESRFYAARVNAGEMIGTIAAQSLGEPTTQMTLNTFHSAGIGTKNVTLGVPRMKEILNASNNIKTPSLSIYLRTDVAASQCRSKKVASSIEYTVLGKLLRNLQIWYDPNILKTVINEDQFLLDLYNLELREDKQESFAPWVLRLELDKTMIIDKDIMTKNIADMLEKNLGGVVRILYSPLNSYKQVIRIRFVYGDDDLMRLPQYEDFVKYLPDFFLKGVKQIHRAMISKMRKTILRNKHIEAWQKSPIGLKNWPEFDLKPDSWVIYTEGSNMSDVMRFDEAINYKEIYSNDLVEVTQTLGIEACRVALFLELKRVIEFDGSSVNYRHLAILVEIMAFWGKMRPINRHGITKHGQTTLTQCSFEEPIDVLMKAATYAKKDKLMGVSDNIIMGKLARLGSASFDMVLDEAFLKKTFLATFDMSKTNTKKTPFSNFSTSSSCPQYSRLGSNSLYSSFHPKETQSKTPLSNNLKVTSTEEDIEKESKFSEYNDVLSIRSPLPYIHSSTSPTYSPISPAYSPTLTKFPTNLLKHRQKVHNFSPNPASNLVTSSKSLPHWFKALSPTSPIYKPDHETSFQ